MERKILVSEFIKNDIMRNRNAHLDEDMDLLSAGILDSLGILNIVAYIDKTLGISIPDEDVVYENFQSVRAITNYLQKFT